MVMIGTKAIDFDPKGFLADEDGAVTADWVVLAAAVCLLSIPVLATIGNSTQTATSEVAADVITNSDR
jgi:Flp pilus assembly pilin Flp